MSRDYEQTKIVQQFNRERTAGAFLSGAGVLLSIGGIVACFSYENPMMLCLTGLGALVTIAGISLRKGARVFGQKAFDEASRFSDSLPPGDNK